MHDAAARREDVLQGGMHATCSFLRKLVWVCVIVRGADDVQLGSLN